MPLLVSTTVSVAVPGSIVLPVAAVPLCLASAMPLLVTPGILGSGPSCGGHTDVGRVDPVSPWNERGPCLLSPMNLLPLLVGAPGLTLVAKAVRRGGHARINYHRGHPRVHKNGRVGACELSCQGSTIRALQDLWVSASPLRCARGLLLHGVV